MLIAVPVGTILVSGCIVILILLAVASRGDETDSTAQTGNERSTKSLWLRKWESFTAMMGKCFSRRRRDTVTPGKAFQLDYSVHTNLNLSPLGQEVS